MIQIIDKYDSVRICDRCGRRKLIHTSYAKTLQKQTEHVCKSCLSSGKRGPYKVREEEDSGFYSPDCKSVFIKLRNRRHSGAQ